MKSGISFWLKLIVSCPPRLYETCPIRPLMHRKNKKSDLTSNSQGRRTLELSSELKHGFPTSDRNICHLRELRTDRLDGIAPCRSSCCDERRGEAYLSGALRALALTGRSSSSCHQVYRQEDLRQNPGVWILPSAIAPAMDVFSV